MVTAGRLERLNGGAESAAMNGTLQVMGGIYYPEYLETILSLKPPVFPPLQLPHKERFAAGRLVASMSNG
ncbi:uncharacterized protein METZ01_LOCUS342778 [marine metagenome]|uniref:Uncharacterized protein n=1 Tax=marine metagenome TaxID=408172 RepID=A0A382QWP4_9ZZZZ